MIRIDVTDVPGRVTLRLGVIAGLVAAAGCGDPPSPHKGDDPALKSSMQKSMEIYKSKTQALKGNPASKSKH